MDESDFGMNIDISGLSGPLLNMAILVASFLGLRLFSTIGREPHMVL